MKIINRIISFDSTKKYFLSVNDNSNEHIEACLLFLPKHGNIICISSQIGCMRKCRFCASGLKNFVRNLTSIEIQEQVEIILNDNPNLLFDGFQVTYMGSGEPLENWDNVFDSIDMLFSKYDILKKINISTIWPQNAMNKYKTINWGKYIDRIHLQFSLHFSNDEERNKYFYSEVPSIKSSIECLNSIANIICDTYRINYIPFNNVNDTEKNIEELIAIMKTTDNSILKISQMCYIKDSFLIPSNNFDSFVEKLLDKIPSTEVFKSDGTDINAGCGQFYNESLL